MAVFRLDSLIPDVPQYLDRHPGNLGLILDDENAPGQRQGCSGYMRRRHSGLLRRARQKKRDRSALAHGAYDRRGTTALLGETVDLREAEPRSQPDLLCREIGLKSLCQHLRRHPRTGVGEYHCDEIACQTLARRITGIKSNVARLDPKHPSFRHGVTRIHRDIEQRQIEFGEIDRHRPRLLRDLHSHLDVGSKRWRQHVRYILDAVPQVYWLGPEHLAARIGQQLPGQALTALGGLRYGSEAPAHCIVRCSIVQHRGIAADHHEQIVEVVRDTAGKLSDRLHSLSLAQCGLSLLALPDLDLEAPVNARQIAGAFVHLRLDAPGISGTEQEQCTQEAGAENADHKNSPALPTSVLGHVRLGRDGLHSITPSAKGERVAKGGVTGGIGKATVKDLLRLQIDEPDADHRSYGSKNSSHERAHSKRNRDHANSVGTLLHAVDKQNADLLPPLLNQANRRCRYNGPGIERRLHCGLAAGLRGEIEPHDVFIALQRLDVGHRQEARPLSGTPTLSRRINLANLKPWQVALLGGLEGFALPGFDLRRPLDCLDRRKALQQALDQVAKIGPR